jgi:hypothetical protein
MTLTGNAMSYDALAFRRRIGDEFLEAATSDPDAHRLHPAHDDSLCFQQAWKGEADTSLIVKICDEGWLRQWVFE